MDTDGHPRPPVTRSEACRDARLSEPFLTVRDVADLLKVSEKTVRRLQSRGDLPSFRVGTQVRFRRTDIEDWVDQQQGTADPVESKN